MSSHHIVRDTQEPALLIASGVNYEWVQDLLAWNPWVLVLEDALDEVLSWDIKIDTVFCSIEKSEAINEKLIHQFPVEIKESKNFLAASLEYLTKRGHKSISIIYEKQDYEVIQTIKSASELIIYHQGFKIYKVPDNHFRKWLDKNTALKIGGRVLKSLNLTGEGDLWQTLRAGFVEIEVDVPEFWLAEKII